MMADYVLAIDKGTTSTSAIVFDKRLSLKASAPKEFRQFYAASGHVEHYAEEIWKSVLVTARAAIKKAKISPSDLVNRSSTIQ